MSTRHSIRDQLSGFPIFQMLIIGLLRLSEPIAFSSFLSYIFFMIKSFRIAKNDAEVSKYSGYLASAFSLSQFVSAVQWGKASDKYGRKPTILLGCLGTAISMIVFGFSTNFYMALIARTMMGLLNGNVSIMRTTVGEIAVAKRHQGIAFSNLSLIWSLGKAIGYYLSGKLTDVDHYRDYKRDLDEKKENGLFDKYPFAFSNIVVASLIFCFIILGWLFLEETHDDIKRKRDIGLDVGDKIRQLCRFETLDRPWHLKDESEARLMSISDEEDYEMESLNNDNSTQQAPVIVVEDSIVTRPIILRITCNFLLSFQNVIYAEFLPVFLAKKVDAKSLIFPFKMKGGFGLTTEAIGNLLSSTGILSVVSVSLLFPVISKHFSLLHAFRCGLALMPVMYVLLPLTVFTIPEYSHTSQNLSKCLLYINGYIIAFIGSMNMSQLTLLIHCATRKKNRALINSYTISVTALARFISPLIWGYVMTLSDIKGYGGLSWWLLGCVCFFALIVTLFTSEDDDQDS